MTMSTGWKTKRAGLVDSTARAVRCSTGTLAAVTTVVSSAPVISAEPIRIRFVMMRLADGANASGVPRLERGANRLSGRYCLDRHGAIGNFSDAAWEFADAAETRHHITHPYELHPHPCDIVAL